MPTFNRFGILLRLGRPHEPSSRPPGRPSPGEVEGGGHRNEKSKRKGPPGIETRAAKRGERSDFHFDDHMHLGILHTKYIYYVTAAPVRSTSQHCRRS